MGDDTAQNYQFGDIVNRIIHRVDLMEGREGGTAAKDANGASSSTTSPLTVHELSELSLLCTVAASLDQNDIDQGFAAVEGDQLMALIDLLDRHVNSATSCHLLTNAIQILGDHNTSKASVALEQWLRDKGEEQLRVLRKGLEAAAIVAFIVTYPGIDRRAINEDAIEGAITLMRMHLLKNLIPAFNQTGHVPTRSLDSKANDTSPSKKRRRASTEAAGGTAKDLKKVYKLLLETVPLHLSLTERIERLLKTIPLDDQQILMITNSSIAGLEIECNSSKELSPGQQLQLASISVITSAFRRYPTHRDVILEDLFPVMLRLPTGKRSLRACTVNYGSVPSAQSLASFNTMITHNLLPFQQPHSIQMMTVLVLALVQSAVQPPKLITVEAEDGTQVERFTSGLAECQATADSLCALLLKRCARKGGVEFRPILTNLFEDVMSVLMVPGYPGAEILLYALIRRIDGDLTKANSSTEMTYLNTAFDILGKVGAMQARLLAAARENPLMPCKADTPMSDDGQQEVQLACYCASDKPKSMLLQCQHCTEWYHADCVGVHPEQVPEHWACDACRLGRIWQRERSARSGDIDAVYALQHALVSVVSHRDKAAGQVHLARWMDQLQHTGQSKSTEIISALLQYWNVPGPGAEPLTETGTNRLVLSVLTNTSPFLLTFRQQVGFLIKLMGDLSSHTLRKLSLKAIEKTVEGDPQLMLLPIIAKALTKRLTDDAISVREAAVSLVGTYVLHSPAVASSFQRSLLSCLTDAGVSVRKRAVRIFQDILMNNPRYKGRAVVCDAMLQRAADPKEEEGVRELIEELFVKLWLNDGETVVEDSTWVISSDVSSSPGSPGGAAARAQHRLSYAGIVTPTPPPPGNVKRKRTSTKRADLAAEQMMEVVRASGTNERLESLLAKLFQTSKNTTEKRRAKGDRKKNRDLSNKECDQLVNSLIELLISIEEERSTRASWIGKDLAATLQTLVLFADLAPETVLSRIDVLLPYMTADNNVSMDDENAIVTAISDIIHRLSIALGQTTSVRLSSTGAAKSFENIVYKFGMNALEAAIRALLTLMEYDGSGTDGVYAKKVLHIAKRFYGFLGKKNSIEDFSTESEEVRSSVHRALAALGFTCQYQLIKNESEWDAEVESECPLIPYEDVEWENLPIACYRAFSSYMTKLDGATKCAALRAFCGMFLAQPRLMLSLDRIGFIGTVMSKEAEPHLQLIALQCWQRILFAEEKRIDSGKAKAKMDHDETMTTAKRIAGDQDGDATVFGGVLTNHAERLFQMTQAKNEKIRYAALDLIGLLLRQGQINPNDATPYLFALQGDVDNPPIRNLALRLLMNEGERRPDMLRQRVCAGVKKAYAFQRALNPSTAEVSAVVKCVEGASTVPECVFGSVFKECIASSRKQRHGLFSSLISLFNVGIDSAGVEKTGGRRIHGSDDLFLLSFVAQILAYLPYCVATDPLFIIHKIDSMVTLNGGQILERLAAVLRPIGLSSSDELDDVNFAEDSLERAARSKFPSRTQEAKALSSKDFDDQAFSRFCRAGSALALLLRLKAFFRQLYNLSEARILEFDPNAKEVVAEKGVARSQNAKNFDASVAMDGESRHGRVNTDALIRQYAEFRRLMREETNLGSQGRGSSSPSASEDEKMAIAAPSKKRKADGLA